MRFVEKVLIHCKSEKKRITTSHKVQFLPVTLVLQLHCPVTLSHDWPNEPILLQAHAVEVWVKTRSDEKLL